MFTYTHQPRALACVTSGGICLRPTPKQCERHEFRCVFDDIRYEHYDCYLRPGYIDIGLVPCAIPGVSIDVFLKGGGPPPESYQALPSGFNSAYAMMVERAQQAQEQGHIRGILFHQGESNCGQNDWVDKVASIVSDLRSDLGLGEDVPFIAGEIPPPNSCSQSHNPKVNEIPNVVPNSAVVSAQGTTIHDQYHFDTASVRVMGQRYAETFLNLVPEP